MAAFWTHFLIDLFQRSPQLLERRLRREEVDAEQKMFQRIFGPITLAAFALTGLDFSATASACAASTTASGTGSSQFRDHPQRCSCQQPQSADSVPDRGVPQYSNRSTVASLHSLPKNYSIVNVRIPHYLSSALAISRYLFA
jgi:hypothetical protein